MVFNSNPPASDRSRIPGLCRSTGHSSLDAPDARVEPLLLALVEGLVVLAQFCQRALERLEALLVVVRLRHRALPPEPPPCAHLLAEPKVRQLLVQECGALQEHEAPVRRDVEDPRSHGHADAVLGHAHWRVNRVVHVRCRRVPDVLMDPREPHEQDAQDALQGQEIGLLRGGPIRVAFRRPAERWQMLDHGLIPRLHCLVIVEGFNLFIHLAQATIDELVVQPLYHARPVMPAPTPFGRITYRFFR
mmetsp:Transcript_82970/g.253569  ORF Transcript_82970/g.253569 Transcript_82970/m.253569 type:complete len:247 (+) Transcript_82970:1-741(+)